MIRQVANQTRWHDILQKHEKLLFNSLPFTCIPHCFREQLWRYDPLLLLKLSQQNVSVVWHGRCWYQVRTRLHQKLGSAGNPRMALHQSANARMTAQRGASRTSLKPANKPCVYHHRKNLRAQRLSTSQLSAQQNKAAALAFPGKIFSRRNHYVLGGWNLE